MTFEAQVLSFTDNIHHPIKGAAYAGPQMVTRIQCAGLRGNGFTQVPVIRIQQRPKYDELLLIKPSVGVDRRRTVTLNVNKPMLIQRRVTFANPMVTSQSFVTSPTPAATYRSTVATDVAPASVAVPKTTISTATVPATAQHTVVAPAATDISIVVTDPSSAAGTDTQNVASDCATPQRSIAQPTVGAATDEAKKSIIRIRRSYIPQQQQ